MNLSFINNLFDNIYVLYINNDELFNITNKLQDYNLKCTFFKGINGYDDTEDKNYNIFLQRQIVKKKNDKKIIILSKGQYGHIKKVVYF